MRKGPFRCPVADVGAGTLAGEHRATMSWHGNGDQANGLLIG